MATFAERLRRARLGAGLTQMQVAVRAGTGLPTISRLETGATGPRPETVRKLADALGVSPAWLLFGEGEADQGKEAA